MSFVRQVLITSVAALGMVGLGAGIGFASPLLPQLREYGLGGNPVSHAVLPWIGKTNKVKY